jgi:uncharacterized protein YfaP (DUF2135 family)
MSRPAALAAARGALAGTVAPRRRARRLGRIAAAGLMAAALLPASCVDRLVDPPAPPAARVSVSYAVAGAAAAAGGAAQAYDRADALHVQILASDAVLVDSAVAFTPAPEVHASFQVSPPADGRVVVAVQLLLGGQPLFGGQQAVTLTSGQTTPVQVPLAPVAARIAAPDTLPFITSRESTVQLQATALFATGDTIRGATIAWSSLDPGIASVSGTGLVTPVSSGSARIVASYGGASATIIVPVSFPGVIAGQVVDAVSARGLLNAAVRARRSGGRDSTVASAVTDANGNFSLTLPAGSYTVIAAAGNFIADSATNVVVQPEQTTHTRIALSPTVPAGVTRIVLSWGASPLDLDSHLTTPASGNCAADHVYFSTRGSQSGCPFALLDTDQTDGFGPETITIYSQLNGTYCYGVDQYSSDGTLAGSGATVSVFQSSGLIARFTVPDQPGNNWTVFSLSGTVPIPVNRMTTGDIAAPPGC